MTLAAGEREAAAMLVCLDALEPLCANGQGLPAPAWRSGAAALLAHARTHAWPIAHVLRPRPGPGEGGWRPSPGLSPLPVEPVFHREGPSAFGSAAFRALARAPASKRLVLVGCSTDSACLATALDGVQAGLRLVLPLDALALSALEMAGLRGLAALAERTRELRLTLGTTRSLVGSAAELRVIRGGRA